MRTFPVTQSWATSPVHEVSCAHQSEFPRNVLALAMYGVLEVCSKRREKMKSFVRYVEVPKKEGVGRAIADGRKTNRAFVPPHPVNLPRMPNFLSELATCKAKFFVVAD